MLKGQTDIQKELKEIKEKALDDDVVIRTFYQSLDGYPLNTVEEFKEIEHESKKLERQKLVNTFMNPLHFVFQCFPVRNGISN